MRRILLGSLATLALVSSGLASPGVSSVAIDRSSGPGHARTATSEGRLFKGTSIWRDPDTLTRKQAAAMESRQRRIAARGGVKVSARPNGSVTIPVDFHGITGRNGKGFVSKARIHKQVRVLNRAYSGRQSRQAADTPFRFRLHSISRTKNARWYNANYDKAGGKALLDQMKRRLHVGDARHLNMYSVGFGPSNLLGFATFPGTVPLKLDGVVLLNGSLPGGNATGGPGTVYNLGDTATHEVGHWLNLYHTFQGNCSGLNDYVTDTPRQKAGNNIYQNATVNSCGSPNGPSDPGHNFMSYADDLYLNQFTRGQRDRMNLAWYIRQVLALS